MISDFSSCTQYVVTKSAISIIQANGELTLLMLLLYVYRTRTGSPRKLFVQFSTPPIPFQPTPPLRLNNPEMCSLSGPGSAVGEIGKNGDK